jgi:hypothetical protein
VNIKNLLTRLAASAAVALSLGVAVPALAQCNDPTQGIVGAAECAQPDNVPTELFGSDSIFQNVANILIFLVGAISVIMLIVGGLRYVLSSGDSSAVASAKNTILYAIIGIVVAILAFAAVNFVVTRLAG